MLRATTGLPAYSDSAGTLKKCHCKRGASYCVTVSKHFYYERSIGNLKKCHCKQSSPNCVTVTGITVSGMAWSWNDISVLLWNPTNQFISWRKDLFCEFVHAHTIYLQLMGCLSNSLHLRSSFKVRECCYVTFDIFQLIYDSMALASLLESPNWLEYTTIVLHISCSVMSHYTLETAYKVAICPRENLLYNLFT